MEIADALYGVTMRGDGVTQVISQRLRDAAERRPSRFGRRRLAVSRWLISGSKINQL